MGSACAFTALLTPEIHPETCCCVKSAAFSVELVRRFQGCDEWKSQTSIDLHEVADGLEMHSLRLKAVELYGDSRPLETHQDLDA